MKPEPPMMTWRMLFGSGDKENPNANDADTQHPVGAERLVEEHVAETCCDDVADREHGIRETDLDLGKDRQPESDTEGVTAQSGPEVGVGEELEGKPEWIGKR